MQKVGRSNVFNIRTYSIILLKFATVEFVTAFCSILIQSRFRFILMQELWARFRFFVTSKLFPNQYMIMAFSGPCRLTGGQIGRSGKEC